MLGLGLDRVCFEKLVPRAEFESRQELGLELGLDNIFC